MSNSIEVVDICPVHNDDAQPLEPIEDVEPEQVVIMKKPRAKRVAKPKEESGSVVPKAKRAPRKPNVVVIDEEPEIDEPPLEEEEPEDAPPPPPPLAREKKPRAKRAPQRPVDDFAAAPSQVGNQDLTDLLAQHIMDLRCRKVELKQQRIQSMVAGKIA